MTIDSPEVRWVMEVDGAGAKDFIHDLLILDRNVTVSPGRAHPGRLGAGWHDVIVHGQDAAEMAFALAALRQYIRLRIQQEIEQGKTMRVAMKLEYCKSLDSESKKLASGLFEDVEGVDSDEAVLERDSE